MKNSTRYKIVTILNRIIPKNKRKIFFFDRGLISFNEIELARYLENNNPDHDYKLVFCTNCVDKAKSLFPRNVLVVHSDIRGLYHQLTSKYVFVEQNGHKWVCEPTPRQKIVQLWHGTPIKRVGNLNNSRPWYKYDDAYSLVLATSNYAWQIMKACFDYNNSKRIICPYPRCDAIDRGLTEEQKMVLTGSAASRIILWLPTFRTAYYEEHSCGREDFPILNESNAEVLNHFLIKNNCVLLIKYHALQRKIPLFSNQYTHIKFIQNSDLINQGITLYNLIGESDCLISDYSSVIFDYLLHNRPMVFTDSDFDNYKNQRGFINEELFYNLPGGMASTMSDLIDALNEALTTDPYKAERMQLNRKMNAQVPNNYCRQVLLLVGILNEKEV